MANTSIFNAFERMWQHIVAALGNKSNLDHTHTPEEVGAAPSNAIVDRSPKVEEELREDFGAMEWWTWEKRIDGTFNLTGGVNVYAEIPADGGNPIYLLVDVEEHLPFDFLDMTSVSYHPIHDWDDIDLFDTLDIDVTCLYQGGGLPDYFTIQVNATDDTFENMRNMGINVAGGMLEITIMGKWREG